MPTGMEMHTFGRVKELLQSSGGFLQFFILVGLEDHLRKVKVFDQPGFWAALRLVLLCDPGALQAYSR